MFPLLIPLVLISTIQPLTPQVGARAVLVFQFPFTQISKLSDLPIALVRLRMEEKTPRLAEIGEDFNNGCVQDHRPSGRLLFAGQSNRYVIIAYDQGGYSVSSIFEIFELQGGFAKRVDRGFLPEDIRSLPAFMSSAGTGAFSKFRRF